jgi:hypothetical protein
MASRKQ